MDSPQHNHQCRVCACTGAAGNGSSAGGLGRANSTVTQLVRRTCIASKLHTEQGTSLIFYSLSFQSIVKQSLDSRSLFELPVSAGKLHAQPFYWSPQYIPGERPSRRPNQRADWLRVTTTTRMYNEKVTARLLTHIAIETSANSPRRLG